jgi:hypothetical protein
MWTTNRTWVRGSALPARPDFDTGFRAGKIIVPITKVTDERESAAAL